jgi:hypothetical protein
VRRTFFGSVQHYDAHTLCTPPILFNGHQLPTARFRDSERGSYYLQTTETDFYIPTLDFYHWGTGAPLTLRTAHDLSNTVRTAVVTVVDVVWEEQQQHEQREREEARAQALRHEREAAAHAEAQARVERARQEAERQEQMQREHEEAHRQARERQASRIRTSVVAGAFGLFVLFLWWLIGTSDKRRAARLEHQRRERQEQEVAAAARARARAQEEEAKRRAEKEQRRQEQERREREHEEAEAERRRKAEELTAQRRERIRAIHVRYGDALFAWRTKDEEIGRYALEHRHELLDPKRTTQIIHEYEALHEDADFADWLRTEHPDLYHRIDAVFFYRARALAESLPKEPPTPPRPKLTPEERQAKFERYRERALERDRIQAEDRMAAVRQKLELARQFRQDLDAYDIDEEERDRIVKEFEDDLLTSTEELADGFKKL